MLWSMNPTLLWLSVWQTEGKISDCVTWKKEEKAKTRGGGVVGDEEEIEIICTLRAKSRQKIKQEESENVLLKLLQLS